MGKANYNFRFVRSMETNLEMAPNGTRRIFSYKFPKQSLRRRGSYGLAKDAYDCAAIWVARHFDR